MRLSKRMSELGIASRREADEWIPKGWVRVDGRVVGAIGPGLLVLAAVAADDDDADREWLARKIVALRIFDDDTGVMNRSVADIGGAILAVSQFTLFASTRKGARPSWSGAAPPPCAR